MPVLQSNGIQIAYDTFGDPLAPALLLIMGFSGQMILWEEAFCDQLARRGFFVIRFDNRDAGLSSKIEDPTCEGPYTLSDMARDSVGLMDGLGIDRAHICGTSMGGMIAQHIALLAPERIVRLVLASTTTTGKD